jgi:hypothetical protein
MMRRKRAARSSTAREAAQSIKRFPVSRCFFDTRAKAEIANELLAARNPKDALEACHRIATRLESLSVDPRTFAALWMELILAAPVEIPSVISSMPKDEHV